MNEKLLKIISFYGVIPQLKYFQSEVFELNEAIIRYEQHLRDNLGEATDDILIDNIVEEIADVMVMLIQFMEYYDISATDIQPIFDMKVDRQVERIENEN